MKCKLISFGGAGCNIADSLFKKVDTTMICTDVCHINMLSASEKFLSGTDICLSLGCGGDPVIGYLAAAESFPKLDQQFNNEFNLFVFGLGGGTGTGHARYILPKLRQSNLEKNVYNIALCTMPFDIERGRVHKAKAFLPYISCKTDLFIIVEQQSILSKIAADFTIKEIFHHINEIIAEWLEKIAKLDYQKIRLLIDNYKGVVEINSQESVDEFNSTLKNISKVSS